MIDSQVISIAFVIILILRYKAKFVNGCVQINLNFLNVNNHRCSKILLFY